MQVPCCTASSTLKLSSRVLVLEGDLSRLETQTALLLVGLLAAPSLLPAMQARASLRQSGRFQLSCAQTPLTSLTKQRGRRRRQSSLAIRPSVRDPTAPPLVKPYLSYRNFMLSAALTVAIESRFMLGLHSAMSTECLVVHVQVITRGDRIGDAAMMMQQSAHAVRTAGDEGEGALVAGVPQLRAGTQQRGQHALDRSDDRSAYSRHSCPLTAASHHGAASNIAGDSGWQVSPRG